MGFSAAKIERTLLLAFLIALSGCLLETQKHAGRGSEIENEVGLLVQPDGKPAGDALVTVYPVEHIPGNAADPGSGVFTTRTDEDGKYSLASLPPGTYNILGKKGAHGSYRDSLEIGDRSDPIPTDTLRTFGSLTGIVSMEPNHDLRTVTVQVLGTDNFSNVDDEGHFTLSGLANGAYRMRVVTTVPDYTPLFPSFRVNAGQQDTLSDTLEMIYTGIPVVRGLEASYDSTAGRVLLRWNRVRKNASVADYLIYREKEDELLPGPQVIGRTRDTALVDAVYPDIDAHATAPGDTSDPHFIYRVLVRLLNGKTGELYGIASLDAPSPDRIRTFASLSVSSDRVGIGDSAVIFAHWKNLSFAVTERHWEVDGETRNSRVDPAKQGADTLRVAWQRTGTHIVRFHALDARGGSATDSVILTVYDDTLHADAGLDQVRGIGDTLGLQGKSGKRFEGNVTWEWDIGATGVFSQTSSGDTIISLPQKPDSVFLCVLRVTDMQGRQKVDTMRTRIHPIQKLPLPPDAADGDFQLVPLEGKIYKVGGYFAQNDFNATAFDTSSRTWETQPPMKTRRGGFQAVAMAGKIYVVGGLIFPLNYSSADVSNRFLEQYDPATKQWQAKALPAGPNLRTNLGATVCGGKLYILGGDTTSTFREESGLVEEYDPDLDQWMRKSPLPTARAYLKAATLDGKIYAIGGRAGSELSNLVERYDPELDTWTRKASLPTRRELMAVEAVRGRIYAIAKPDTNDYSGGPVYVYDPAADAWTQTYSTTQVGVAYGTSTSTGTEIYLMGWLTDLSPADSGRQRFFEAYLPAE